MKTLKEFIQKYAARADLGVDEARLAAKAADQAHDDLRQIQAINNRYFKSYWIMLSAAFIVTVVFALIYRSEMGGLSVVLGAGGVVQGGLIVLLSSALKEKSRIDMIAVLSRRLNQEQLFQILSAMQKEGSLQGGRPAGKPGEAAARA